MKGGSSRSLLRAAFSVISLNNKINLEQMQHILVASALECDFHIDYVQILKSNSTPDWKTEFHLFSLSG